MILATMLLMAANVPQSLLDRADEANLAYVRCLFGVTREANAAGLRVEQFERRMAESCLSEESSVRSLGSRILTLRGNGSPAASVDGFIRQTKRKMVEDYRKLPQQKQALEELARVCRQQPEACRH